MASSSVPADGHGDPTRRDFLMVATGALGAVGAAAVAWPFINNLNPAADTLALASIEVNVKPIEVGQAITVNHAIGFALICAGAFFVFRG